MSLKYDDKNLPYIDLGNNCIVRRELQEITEKEREKAREELRETDEIRPEAIKELKALLKEEKNLSVPYDDEKFLMPYLRACHFYPKSAFEKVQNYYRFKKKNPKYTENLFPHTVRKVFEAEIVQLSPKRTQNGCRTLFVHIPKWKTSEINITDIFRCVAICVEAAMQEPSTLVNGVVVVFDVEDISVKHMWQLSPSFASMMINYITTYIPLRTKEMHIVYNSKFFNVVFEIFKPFLNEKLRNRIHFHGKDMKSLHKFMDPSCLRPRFEGTMDCAPLNGSLVADMFELHNKEYELESNNGYLDKI